MKISLKWVNDFVEIRDFYKKPEELADLLTKAGLEVEGIENRAKTFENVVVGNILEKGKHPDADRLTLCQVTTGKGIVHQIVCGAKNHNAGDNVVVALPGAILPGNFEIKKSKIRGVESQGMLCSETELGIADTSEGILILPTDAPVGKAFADYMGYDDVIIELKVTPNRSDCLGHYGMAREIACLLDRPMTHFLEDNLEKLKPNGDTQTKIKVEVKNKEGCPRYTGAYVGHVQVKASPDWMKKRLESVGMKSINNIVDITNYVMMELGQPLHAFDCKQIQGAHITIDEALPGTEFKTLDGTTLKLQNELMIHDQKRAVAMAGIVGGENSGIQEATENVFIESAYFKPETVRRNARKHGIQTESSYRFSRGIDPDMVFKAMKRCCQLIQDLAGGVVHSNAYDIYSEKIRQRSIPVSLDYVSDRLGYSADHNQLSSWMKRLGCDVVETQKEITVTVPAFRHDLQLPEDIVEEYARLNGYEHIPEILPIIHEMPSPHETRYTQGVRVNELARGLGFQEALNYNFVDSKFSSEFIGEVSIFKDFGLTVTDMPIQLKNPISSELGIMRTLITPGLVKNLIHNYNRGIEFGRLYETGYTFLEYQGQYVEPWNLALIGWGLPTNVWSKTETPVVYDLKSKMDVFLKNLSSQKWKWESVEKSPQFLHPGQTLRLKYEGRFVGFLGTLHPGLTDQLKIRANVAVGEFNLEFLMQGQPRTVRTKPITKFPSVSRDVTFVMIETVESQVILDEIIKIGKPLLESVSVVDQFKGSPLQAGHKALTYRLVYTDPKETLTESKVAEINSKIINEICKSHKVSVR